jgi:hypothetical protein
MSYQDDQDFAEPILLGFTGKEHTRLRLHVSTAFHPKTDGQSVCAFGVFQEMIRPFLVSFNGTGTRISLS